MIGRQYSFKFDLFINDEATTSGHNVIQAHPWIWVWYKKDKKILEIDVYNVNGRTHRSEIGKFVIVYFTLKFKYDYKVAALFP